MNHENDGPELGRFDPEDLDGHTLDELVDYLESGRSPRDPSIENSAGCQLALDALERLHGLAPELLQADLRAEPEPDEAWVDRVIGGIAMDVRAGRRIPYRAPSENIDLGITEGAVRGVIRGAENAIPGLLIGRTRLHGDVTAPDEPIRIELEAAVPWGEPISGLADRLRAEVAERLARHTELNVVGIDIVVHDIRRARDDDANAAEEGDR